MASWNSASTHSNPRRFTWRRPAAPLSQSKWVSIQARTFRIFIQHHQCGFALATTTSQADMGTAHQADAVLHQHMTHVAELRAGVVALAI